MIRVLLAAALAFAAGCATVEPSNPATEATTSADATAAVAHATAQADQAESASSDGDELICRNERVIGSRLPRRVCGTQRSWDAMREGSQETLREVQSRPTGAVEEGG